MYQFNSKEVVVGGHEFVLMEPHGRACIRVVGIVMHLIGQPEKLLASIREAAQADTDTISRGLSIGFKMTMSSDRFESVPDGDIDYLLEQTTDKSRHWYSTNPLSGPDLLELIAEVASILPFGGVLSQKGNLAGALVQAFTTPSNSPATSSESGTDGDQKTSEDAGSDGYVIPRSGMPGEPASDGNETN